MRVMKKIQTLTLFSRNFQAPGTGFVVVGALAVPLFVCCCCGLFAILCPTLLQPHGLWPSRLLCPWNFPDKNTGVGCHFLLQGSSQPRDWTCISYVSCIGRWIFFLPLSHLGSPPSWEGNGNLSWALTDGQDLPCQILEDEEEVPIIETDWSSELTTSSRRFSQEHKVLKRVWGPAPKELSAGNRKPGISRRIHQRLESLSRGSESLRRKWGWHISTTV